MPIGRAQALMVVLVLSIAGTALLFYPYFAIALEGTLAPKTYVLGLSALAIGCLFVAAPRDRQQRLSLFEVIVICYFAAGVASWQLHRPQLVDLASWLGPEWSAALLAFGAAELTVERKQRERVLVAFLAVAVLVAAVALLEAAGVHLPWAAIRRPQSTLGNRNIVAAYTAMALPIAAWRLAASPSVRRGSCVSILFLVILMTRCRGAWLALFASAASAAALWLWCLRRGQASSPSARASIALALSLAIAIASAAFVPWPGLRWTEPSPLLSSLQRIGEYWQGSGQVRVEQYRIGFFIFKDHPLLGVGPRRWSEAAAEYAHLQPGAHVPSWRLEATPHSEFVRIMTEFGLVGLALVLLGALVTSRSVLSQVGAESQPGMAIATAASLIVVGVCGLFDAPLFHPALLTAAAILLGTLGPARHLGMFDLATAPVRAVFAVGALVAFVFAALPLAAAVQIRRGEASNEALLAGQRWFPRPTVSHLLINDWVAKNQCDPAEAEIERAMQLCPHCWGALLLGARCEQRRGRPEEAQRYRSRALAIEPHSSVVAVAHP